MPLISCWRYHVGTPFVKGTHVSLCPSSPHRFLAKILLTVHSQSTYSSRSRLCLFLPNYILSLSKISLSYFVIPSKNMMHFFYTLRQYSMFHFYFHIDLSRFYTQAYPDRSQFHHHFASNAMFINCKFDIPRPSCFFGLHTGSHLTRLHSPRGSTNQVIDLVWDESLLGSWHGQILAPALRLRLILL